MDKSYEDLFDEKIKERGRKYYFEDKIKRIRKYTNRCTGKLFGRNIYNVSVSFDNNLKIKSMHCTCPYFKSNNTCKHLYAFLYKIDYEHIYDDKEKEDNSSFFSKLIKFISNLDNNCKSNYEVKEEGNETYDEEELEEKMNDLNLEEWQKDLIRKGDYELEDFEEEEINEDSYYFDDEE